MRLRDWSDSDFYAELGVSSTATRDEITAAYRARVRVLHPDAAPDDPAAEEQFHRIATAYEVLTGPQRYEYDEVRQRRQRAQHAQHAQAVANAPVRPAAAGSVAPKSSERITRRGARWAFGGGVGLVVLGLVAAVAVTMLQIHDANLRDDGEAATATVVTDAGSPQLEFTISRGQAGDEVVRTGIPDAKSGALTVGDSVEIRYDPDNPTRVVTAANTVARDITLWIVVAKFLIVGTVLAIVGARRLARPT